MRRAWIALVVGGLLAVGAPVGWTVAHRSAPGFGAGQAAALSEPSPPAPGPATGLSAPGSPAPSLAPPEGPDPAAATVGVRSALVRDQTPVPPDPPVMLTLAGTDVPVLPVGLDGSGGVEVPEDVQRAGWYRFGAAPGDPVGAAVLVGHVDAATQGLGAFSRLRDLQAGAPVTVRTAAGAVRRYRVLSREQWHKGEAPLQRLFDTAGPPRLVLLSCAGTFDRRTHSYSDNVAVTALPATDAG